MTENNKGSQPYSKAIANATLLESKNTQKVVSYLLREHVPEQRSWDYGINDLLCDYYVNLKHFITLLVEITSYGSLYDEDRDEEVYKVPMKYYLLLKTYTKMMSHCELELKYTYRISTMIH